MAWWLSLRTPASSSTRIWRKAGTIGFPIDAGQRSSPRFRATLGFSHSAIASAILKSRSMVPFREQQKTRLRSSTGHAGLPSGRRSGIGTSSRLSTLDVPVGMRQASIACRNRLHQFSLQRRCWSLRFSQARDVDDDQGNIVLLRHRGRLPAPQL
jgi:hypothetical protein